ncbi:MAG: 1-acyl-sn-glycerol-3-phosphate acyltransferase [Candidatus Latescibacterota bacterium]|jgi:1-acyl-sn-glycerol-3-phosphate acyltransferase
MRRLRVIRRLILFSTAIIGMYSIIVVGRIVCQIRGRSWIGWRNKWVRIWARYTIWITGGRLTVIGNPPKPPFVLVSNHLTYIDIPAFFASVDSVFVSKMEVRSWPILGRIVTGVNTIFVDRTRRSDVVRVNELIAEQIDDQKGLIIFPEGTSTEGAEVLPFKPSLLAFPASQGVPVHYAAISYRTPPGEIPAHISVCWAVNGGPFLTHLMRFSSISSYEIEVRYGAEPVLASDRKVLAEELWTRICQEFVPSVKKESECQSTPL